MWATLTRHIKVEVAHIGPAHARAAMWATLTPHIKVEVAHIG
jgi:hypothetical protein